MCVDRGQLIDVDLVIADSKNSPLFGRQQSSALARASLEDQPQVLPAWDQEEEPEKSD
jgi:hypothetical protein